MSKIDLNQADHKKVAKIIQNNVLGFHNICIYSVKMDQKDFSLPLLAASIETECQDGDFWSVPR
ncbi:hypothetical protein [Neobacillus sp. NPDC093127]|uniref:hypothetical protein n=1 Tax=Neobacillus sp. NPDC093127 TaxID=3364296 RepID=UPI0038115508